MYDTYSFFTGTPNLRGNGFVMVITVDLISARVQRQILVCP